MTPSSASVPHEVDAVNVDQNNFVDFIEEAEENTNESAHQKHNGDDDDDDNDDDDDDNDGGMFVIYDETASPNAIVDESGGGMMMMNDHDGIEDISTIVLNGPHSVDDWSPCLQVHDDGFGSIHV